MPLTHKTGWLGIDIGAASVKAAQVVRRNGEFVVRSAALVRRELPWPPAMTSNEELRSSADEICAVTSICEEAVGWTASAMLPSSLCDVAQVNVPAGKSWGARELRSTVRTDLHESLDDHVIDWWPAAHRNDRINVAVAPRRWCDQTCADVASAGRRCRIIDALPRALARAVAMVPGERRDRAAIALDYGFSAVTMCLVAGSRVILTRRLRECGFHSLIETVQDGLRLTRYDAEVLLATCSLSNADDSKALSATITQLLGEPLALLEREVRRTLSYWQNQARGFASEHIYLFGGGASLAGIEQSLTQAIGLPVSRWALPVEDEEARDAMPPLHLLGPAVGLSALPMESTWIGK